MVAAITAAGRPGSAFAAQIGTMKLGEKIDAIQVAGFNVVEVLVLPRLLSIVLTLPPLTSYSNIMRPLDSAAMCYLDLGITISEFLNQLRSTGLDVLGSA